ncbi:hypothetical protein QOL99_02760 [Deinococcus sp. MIMF12]|uniref:Fluoride efflux transporter CrcB n=1 Tax=Deinococcus rhizophilus TaxID=3049544 RepID=A0ABT7JDE5_9DEIO|nr:hypothetical protein [Deinococcus rhizophilus]MDL2343065.1 hypothetical protein [Deinococcus rhizophilus]
MSAWLWVMAGGAVGAAARYGVRLGVGAAALGRLVCRESGCDGALVTGQL